MAGLQREVETGGFSTLDKVVASAPLLQTLIPNSLHGAAAAAPDLHWHRMLLSTLSPDSPGLLTLIPRTSPLAWVYLVDNVKITIGFAFMQRKEVLGWQLFLNQDLRHWVS